MARVDDSWSLAIMGLDKEVQELLRELGFERLAPIFAKEEITMGTLEHICRSHQARQELRDIGIPLGQAVKICSAVRGQVLRRRRGTITKRPRLPEEATADQPEAKRVRTEPAEEEKDKSSSSDEDEEAEPTPAVDKEKEVPCSHCIHCAGGPHPCACRDGCARGPVAKCSARQVTDGPTSLERFLLTRLFAGHMLGEAKPAVVRNIVFVKEVSDQMATIFRTRQFQKEILDALVPTDVVSTFEFYEIINQGCDYLATKADIVARGTSNYGIINSQALGCRRGWYDELATHLTFAHAAHRDIETATFPRVRGKKGPPGTRAVQTIVIVLTDGPKEREGHQSRLGQDHIIRLLDAFTVHDSDFSVFFVSTAGGVCEPLRDMARAAKETTVRYFDATDDETIKRIKGCLGEHVKNVL